MGMRASLHFSLMLFFFFDIATSQNPFSSQVPAATTTSTVSLTPEMSASAVSSLYSVLATSSPQQPGNGGCECVWRQYRSDQTANIWPGPSAGDVGSSAGTSTGDTDAGASGPSSGSIELSRGAIIAIIVCAVSVCLLGSESVLNPR
jgi:hypothetical protein